MLCQTSSVKVAGVSGELQVQARQKASTLTSGTRREIFSCICYMAHFIFLLRHKQCQLLYNFQPYLFISIFLRVMIDDIIFARVRINVLFVLLFLFMYIII